MKELLKKKMKDREDLFKKSLGLFLKEISVDRFSSGLPNVQIGVLENAEKTINQYYWNFVENHVRPVISSSEGGVDDHIDLYKLLSATEYSIMAVSPLFLVVNGNKIHPENSELKMNEQLLNAEFAFKCAFLILSNWDGYKDEFSDNKSNSALLTYKEANRKFDECMSIQDEHISILAFTTRNSNTPIFTNATWWRMLCLCKWMLYKSKFDLVAHPESH